MCPPSPLHFFLIKKTNKKNKQKKTGIECWIFRKRQGSELDWMYKEAGYQELSGSKKASWTEHPKKFTHEIIISQYIYIQIINVLHAGSI